MSLINQMLKDLEARHTGVVSTDGGIVADLAPVTSRLPRDPVNIRLKFLPLSVGAIVVGVAFVVNLDAFVETQASVAAGPQSIDAAFDVEPYLVTAADTAKVVSSDETGSSFPSLRLSDRLVTAHPSAAGQLALGPDLLAEVEHLNAMLNMNPPAAGAPGRGVIETNVDSVEYSLDIAADAPTLRNETVSPDLEASEMKTRRPVSEQELAEAIYRDGVKALRAGKTELGDGLMSEALGIWPRHVKAREILATRMVRAQRYQEAIALLTAGAHVLPVEPVFAKLHARILVELGQSEAALAALEGLQPDVVKQPEYHAFRAAMLQRAGLHEQAISVYRQVTQVQPEHSVWWMGLAISLESLGQRADALVAYKQAQRGGSLSADVRRLVQSKVVALSS